MATKSEVRDTAAGMLGRRRIGQAIAADLTARLDQSYRYVYEDLKDDDLAIWASDEDIPDKVAPLVSALMALDASNDVGISNERYQRILIKTGPDGERAKQKIRRKVTPDWESLDDVEDF